MQKRYYIDTFSIDPVLFGKQRTDFHKRIGNVCLKNIDNIYKSDEIGAYGEIGFADLFGLKVDHSLRKHGDTYDFDTNLGTIDVKTRRNAVSVIVANRSRKSDIYVLAAFYEKLKAIEFLGWTTKEEIANSGKVVYDRNNLSCKSLLVKQLRSMEDFSYCWKEVK